jgi:hypothetical protein
VCVCVCVCVCVGVCVCVPYLPACKAHALYFIVIYGLTVVMYFFTLSYKRHDFRKQVIALKMCVLIFSLNVSEEFLVL